MRVLEKRKSPDKAKAKALAQFSLVQQAFIEYLLYKCFWVGF